MRIRYFQASDIGLRKRLNQDALMVLPEAASFAVADGISVPRGEEASRIAVETLSSQLRKAPADEQRLKLGVEFANQAICRAARENLDLEGIGTTLTAVALEENRLLWAHVGDSRLYLCRDDDIHQITTDHSRIERRRVRTGGFLGFGGTSKQLTRQYLDRCLGYGEQVEVDTGTCVVRPDDLLLLCTDGLNNMLDDFEILQIVTRHREARDFDAAVEALIREAKRRGGEDNVSLVLLEVMGDGES